MAKTEVLQGLSKPEPAPKPQLTEFQLSRQFPGGRDRMYLFTIWILGI
jgi:hypothetical protein